MTELARFDALGPHGEGRSFLFRGVRGVVEARRMDEVVPALREVERAVAGGLHAAGFVVYEAAPAFDRALAVRPADERLPLLRFALFAERAEGAPPSADEAAADAFSLGAWTASTSEEQYVADVERIREWIAAGDTYQVNHTFRLRAPFSGSDAALYARMVLAQRAAYCAHLRFGATSILSVSPELFFRRRADDLTLRPMKGTRRRGRWPGEDDALAAELPASAKDRAENVMIVDLLRNDAGRVARFGSVHVPRLLDVERYETVHQMTSTIRAELRRGTTLAEVFGALFPCGSITGAPKVRTSQIIAALEGSPRGVYTGAVGFASPGEAVFNVAIRTLVIDLDGGTAELGVGSGITYDSDAAEEFRECLSKAEFARRTPHDFRLLETILREPDGTFFLLDGHLDRLRESARYFGFRFDAVLAGRRLDDAVRAADGPLRVRLTLARDGELRVDAQPLSPLPATGRRGGGLDAVASTASERASDRTESFGSVDAMELPRPVDGTGPDEPPPVRVAFSTDAVDSRDALLYHKTTRREPYERRAAARPDCGDVLLVNERGEVTESTIANIVTRIDGELWTPPMECGLLPGVFRAALLRRGDVRERVLTVDDVRGAAAVYLVSSVRKWRRATVID
ncbi:MAG: para-aminobenzoate synthase, subunit [Gemmatimonadetes bacterium]|nr:para-aminobenzoate synthase, subunit [Gemmatimonadota bacterium]